MTSLFDTADAPCVVVVVGHYGVGKTNFALNLAFDAAHAGREVTLADLDVVNPYFRSSDYREILEDAGIRLVAPVFAGSTLDSPSISGQVSTAIQWANEGSDDVDDVNGTNDVSRRLLIIDAGGDDVGATALGRFSREIMGGQYALWYVVNHRRNLTQLPTEAATVLREIEAKTRLQATALVNNTHLKQDTDAEVLEEGITFVETLSQMVALPCVCTTVPKTLFDRKSTRIYPNGGAQTLYPVQVYVRTPWE